MVPLSYGVGNMGFSGAGAAGVGPYGVGSTGRLNIAGMLPMALGLQSPFTASGLNSFLRGFGGFGGGMSPLMFAAMMRGQGGGGQPANNMQNFGLLNPLVQRWLGPTSQLGWGAGTTVNPANNSGFFGGLFR